MVGIISAAIPTESDIFVHVLTNVLKQPSDGPLAQALDEAGINEINDLLTLDHQSRNALMYELDDGTIKPLPIGYKNLLRVLKIFVDYCQDSGMPIKDWTAITKRDFDEFRTSHAGLALSKKSNAFSNSAPAPVIAPTPSPPTPKQKKEEKKTQHLKCYLAKPKLLSRPTLVRFFIWVLGGAQGL